MELSVSTALSVKNALWEHTQQNGKQMNACRVFGEKIQIKLRNFRVIVL